MAELSSNLKVFLARELQRQFSSLDNSVALFIAGTEDENVDGVATSTLVDGSLQKELDTRRQLQTAKILQDRTVALMIPRVNWTSGIIYDAHSLTADNSTRNFYVYTSDGNVYVCLSNGGGKKSLEEPTGTGPGKIYLSNGYIWKFMFRVPSELFDFIDSNYIPIKEIPIYENKPFAYGSDEKQLQYAVQYASGGGVVQSISLLTQGGEYVNTVKASARHKPREFPTALTIKLDSRSSGVDDVYNEYTIKILSGVGAGQIKKIVDYDGSTKTATLESAWATVPSPDDLYEIVPSINIEGDGTGAVAFAKMHSYAANTIDAIVVADGGTRYTTATATVSPAISPATTVNVSVDPTGDIGRDPIFDLLATRISILIKIEGREKQRAVLGNDYRQYGLWFAPKIGAGYSGEGKVAGTEAYIRTTVDLEPSAGMTFSDSWTRAGQFIFGGSSYNTGKVASVTNPFTKFSLTRGQVILDGLNSKFRNGETVYTFTTNPETGGYTFTGNTAKVTNTLFEDSIRSSFTETYRCSHKLGVSRTDGLSFDPGTPFTSIPFDAAVTGGSGGQGVVLDFTNVSGGSGDVFVTNVVAGSQSDLRGFVAGETLAINNLELNITDVSGPELDIFSGKILYINDVEQVKRNAEQLDLFKINFDF